MDFAAYFKDKKITVMGLGCLGNPSVFQRFAAFRHGEPDGSPTPSFKPSHSNRAFQYG